MSLLFRTQIKVMNESSCESECALLLFPLICPLIVSGCIFAFRKKAWITTFEMDFVMEPLTGDRSDGTERIPCVVVVIGERDG